MPLPTSTKGKCWNGGWRNLKIDSSYIPSLDSLASSLLWLIHLLDKIIARKELMSTQLYFPWERDTKQAQSRAVITLQVFRGFIGNY